MTSPPRQTGHIAIRVLREWDTVLLRTDKLVPATSASVLLDFRVSPDPEEAGLPATLAGALAQALLAHGTVAGRWFEQGPVPPGATPHRFTRDNLLHRLADRLRSTQPEPVITTRSLELVRQLLDTGWSVQQQALLVLDPNPSLPPDDILRTLATGWDWTAFSFPPPALALVAPGNDGDYILIAAPDEARLTPILESVLHAFRTSGFTLQP